MSRNLRLVLPLLAVSCLVGHQALAAHTEAGWRRFLLSGATIGCTVKFNAEAEKVASVIAACNAASMDDPAACGKPAADVTSELIDDYCLCDPGTMRVVCAAYGDSITKFAGCGEETCASQLLDFLRQYDSSIPACKK